MPDQPRNTARRMEPQRTHVVDEADGVETVSVVASPEQLLELIKEKADPRSNYQSALALLSAIGTIDAFPLSLVNESKCIDLVESFWKDIVRECALSLIFSNQPEVLKDPAFEGLCGISDLDFHRQHYDKDVLGSKKRLRFSQGLRPDGIFSDFKRLLDGHTKEEVLRWLGNLALVKALIVQRKSAAFIHISPHCSSAS